MCTNVVLPPLLPPAHYLSVWLVTTSYRSVILDSLVFWTRIRTTWPLEEKFPFGTQHPRYCNPTHCTNACCSHAMVSSYNFTCSTYVRIYVHMYVHIYTVHKSLLSGVCMYFRPYSTRSSVPAVMCGATGWCSMRYGPWVSLPSKISNCGRWVCTLHLRG